MIHKNKIAAMAAVLVLIAIDGRADQTNLVQSLSIQLSGIAQGQPKTNGNVVRTGFDFVRVGTGDVITQLGSATGNSFSSKAKLVVVTPLPSGSSAIVVRDGSSSADVTSFFVYEQKSEFVSTGQTNLRTGRGNSTDYSIQRLALKDSTDNATLLSLHFDVQGVAVETSFFSATAGTQTELDASVSGSGDQNGKLIILEGSFRVQGNTLEVVSTAPPPNT
jgi:uncharacterized lipoprotein NlpE involved in copper resistance